MNEILDFGIKVFQVKPSILFVDEGQLNSIVGFIESFYKDVNIGLKDIKIVYMSSNHDIPESIKEHIVEKTGEELKEYIRNEIKQIENEMKGPCVINVEDYSQLVSSILINLNIAIKCQGFQYLKSIINYCLVRKKKIINMTECYELVAGIYTIDPQNVERTVRNAIEKAWNNYGKDNWSDVLMLEDVSKRPTNFEFVSYIIENIASLNKRLRAKNI